MKTRPVLEVMYCQPLHQVDISETLHSLSRAKSVVLTPYPLRRVNIRETLRCVPLLINHEDIPPNET